MDVLSEQHYSTPEQSLMEVSTALDPAGRRLTRNLRTATDAAAKGQR